MHGPVTGDRFELLFYRETVTISSETLTPIKTLVPGTVSYRTTVSKEDKAYEREDIARLMVSRATLKGFQELLNRVFGELEQPQTVIESTEGNAAKTDTSDG